MKTSLLWLSCVSLAACGQQYSLTVMNATAVRNADNTVTVKAEATCETMNLSSDCSSAGQYCVKAEWLTEGLDAGAESVLETASGCKSDVIAQGNASEVDVQSTAVIPSDGGVKIRLTLTSSISSDSYFDQENSQRHYLDSP